MKNEEHQALSLEIEDFFDSERMDCPDFCNDGIIVVCCDDLCANSDYCIHGDGYAICPTCKGEGEITIKREENDDTLQKM